MALRFNRSRLIKFSQFLWKRFLDDKCFETAGSLSYTTLVSLVPLMVAVFAMFSAFPVFQGARTTLVNFVFDNFVPTAGETVQGAIQGFADNASKLTGISILVMFFSALSMMISIEDRLNQIFRVHHARGWGSRLLLYWAALTLGPILIVGGIAVTSYVTALPLLQGAATQINGIGQSLLSVLPFVVTFITLWLLYAVVPNCKVSRRDSLIGAVLGAVLFEIVRWGFALFVRQAQTYQQIYGALAAIPIFLLWIYLSWVIVILAASIAASVSAFDFHAPKENLPAGAEFLGLLVVLGRLINAQRVGETVSQTGLRELEPYLHRQLVADYFNDLDQAELIRQDELGGWLLCRSLDSTDLLRVYQHSRYRLPLNPLEEAAELGIELPLPLLDLLATLADEVAGTLTARLDSVYPNTGLPGKTTPDATKIAASQA
jgi:membrane protein